MQQTEQQRYLRTEAAAEYIGSTASSLEKLRVCGGGPPYSKVGRIVIYSVGDLDQFVSASRRQSTSEARGAHHG